jgi:seryl-tRNA synthetase
MLTTKYVKEHIDEIRDSLKRRRSDYPIDKLLDLDKSWREEKGRLQELQAQRNSASFEISDLKKKGKDIKKKVESLGVLKTEIEELAVDVSKKEQEIEKLLWNVPNTLHKSVPTGKDENDNKLLKSWGTPNKGLNRGHEEILLNLGFLDIQRAAKTAGARFYYLRGDLVLLEQSLSRFALDELAKRGYTAILPPFMLREKYYKGTSPLSVFEDALYAVAEPKQAKANKDIERLDDELFMISTAEHALAAMHADEVIAEEDLPLKYAGISPSFRREAGKHGKDTKGIYRVHQFNKVEQFIYAKPKDDSKYFDELLANFEYLLQKLAIPYRAMLLSTGDTGHQMSRTVDLEGWFPSQKKYCELGSCSSASDWQSLRLNVRYGKYGGELDYVYTLNCTAITVERTLACVVENYVNADGTITVPDALVPYMGKKKIG